MKVKELLEILNKCRPEAELRLFLSEDIARNIPPCPKDRGWFTYALGFCKWDRPNKPEYVISSIPIASPEPMYSEDYYARDFRILAPVREGER